MNNEKPNEVSVQRSIELTLREHRFADALGLCPDDWALVRQRIEVHQGVCEQSPEQEAPLAGTADELLAISFFLRRVLPLARGVKAK